MWDNIFPKSFENFKIYDLGLRAYNLGDFKGAVKCFKRIIEREPDIPTGWYMLLESLSYLGKWEEMIEIGDEAIKIHPNFGASYFWLGDAYSQLGKRKEAKDCYKNGLNLLEKELGKYPKDDNILKSTILNCVGEINIRLGNYDEAIEYSKRALNISPDEHNLHSIGLVYKEMGDYNKAIEFYEKSLDVNPKHSYAWFDLGLIYEDLNEFKKAIECYEKAVENSPQWVKLREKLLEKKPDSIALLKKAPDIRILFDERIDQQQVKSEIVLNDLNEIENILKDNKLTIEERKYYEQRKLKLTKELELDAELDKLKKDSIKTQMPEDIIFHSPKKAVDLAESILKIQAKLKDTTLTKKERNSLIDQYSYLLDKAEIELIKPQKHELLNEEEKKYFREPLVSYFAELAKKMQKPLNLEYLRPKKSRKAKKKYTIKTNEVPTGVDEEIERLFRFLSKDSLKQILFLDNLDILDKQEDNERNMRCEIEFFSKYLISSYISLRFELNYVSNEEKQELIQQELIKKEKKVEFYERLKFILDQIIDISLTLYNITLTEEKQAYFSQEREKWRNTLKMEFATQIKNGITLEEDFEDFKIKKNQLQEFIRQDKKRLIQIRDLDRLRGFK